VLEETRVGQLEFGFGFMVVLSCWYKAAAGAVEMWESGVFVFCRISKPGGKSGKLALVF